MKIFINSEPKEFPEQSALDEVIKLTTRAASTPFAIAVNERFIPKRDYSQISLQEGDRIELVSPMQGG